MAQKGTRAGPFGTAPRNQVLLAWVAVGEDWGLPSWGLPTLSGEQ